MTEQQAPYVPVSCSFYDYLEEAATRQLPVDILYWQGNICRQIKAVVKTIIINKKAEYLVLANGRHIRLDHLHTFNGVALKMNGRIREL